MHIFKITLEKKLEMEYNNSVLLYYIIKETLNMLDLFTVT